MHDEINKMAPPKKEEMEACPAYGLVLQGWRKQFSIGPAWAWP